MRPILIVDDDVNVRYLFGRVLQGFGFVVIEASDVEVARPLVQHCAIMLLDVNMPGMNGDMWLEELRASGDETPVIVFTGCHPNKALLEKFERFEALEVLEKPVDTSQFPIVIDRITAMIQDVYDLEAVSDRLREYITRRR